LEIDVRRVTDMAFELIRSEPIGACFKHLDWLKISVETRVRSHEHEATGWL
jgi:hypothetical protein